MQIPKRVSRLRIQGSVSVKIATRKNAASAWADFNFRIADYLGRSGKHYGVYRDLFCMRVMPNTDFVRVATLLTSPMKANGLVALSLVLATCGHDGGELRYRIEVRGTDHGQQFNRSTVVSATASQAYNFGPGSGWGRPFIHRFKGSAVYFPRQGGDIFLLLAPASSEGVKEWHSAMLERHFQMLGASDWKTWIQNWRDLRASQKFVTLDPADYPSFVTFRPPGAIIEPPERLAEDRFVVQSIRVIVTSEPLTTLPASVNLDYIMATSRGLRIDRSYFSTD